MNTNTVLDVLDICTILFAVGTVICFAVRLSRPRPALSAPLHPCVFAGIALLLAAKLCDLLRLQSPNRIWFDAFVIFSILFGLIACYLRTWRCTSTALT